MKPHLLRFSTLLLSVLSLQSCMKEESSENRNYVQVAVKSKERYVYDLGGYSNAQSAWISKQARYFDSSYILRDSLTSKYIYKPAPDFTGTDEVELATRWQSYNASSSTGEMTRYTTIRFTVSK